MADEECGLRPGEALALEGADVATKTISVTRALKLDGPGDTKTYKGRGARFRCLQPSQKISKTVKQV